MKRLSQEEMARKGGKAVMKKYGRKHYVAMGKKGRRVVPKV